VRRALGRLNQDQKEADSLHAKLTSLVSGGLDVKRMEGGVYLGMNARYNSG
jgi:hypothetical protein